MYRFIDKIVVGVLNCTVNFVQLGIISKCCDHQMEKEFYFLLATPLYLFGPETLEFYHVGLSLTGGIFKNCQCGSVAFAFLPVILSAVTVNLGMWDECGQFIPGNDV